MNNIEAARLKYKPRIIKSLFIAEAPPKIESERFFYFENVRTQDSLFLELMKFLYPDDTNDVKPSVVRDKKEMFLTKFKSDGFYLIDSLDAPFHKVYSKSQKVKFLKENQGTLLKKVKSLINENTRVILISATVFSAHYPFLTKNGIPVLNIEPVDFPGSGRQKIFRQKMQRLLQPNLL